MNIYTTTLFVNDQSVLTFADGTNRSRRPRRGQWIQLAWVNRRSRYIGTTPAGTLVIDHDSGSDFAKFSLKCKAFDQLYSNNG